MSIGGSGSAKSSSSSSASSSESVSSSGSHSSGSFSSGSWVVSFSGSGGSSSSSSSVGGSSSVGSGSFSSGSFSSGSSCLPSSLYVEAKLLFAGRAVILVTGDPSGPYYSDGGTAFDDIVIFYELGAWKMRFFGDYYTGGTDACIPQGNYSADGPVDAGMESLTVALD